MQISACYIIFMSKTSPNLSHEQEHASITSRLSGIEQKLDKNSDDIEHVKRTLGHMAVKQVQTEARLQEIEEHVSYIPKIYDSMNAFMVEIKESRQERVAMNARFERLERHAIA